jgi:hypothetical protein
MYERMIEVSREVNTVAGQSLREIQGVTRATKMLATNASIEAAHAGDRGKGFAIVADEVGRISGKIQTITESLGSQLDEKFAEMDQISQSLMVEARGTRLADLSLMMIDIIDRNLFERSCDVRWWATDSAMVEAAENATPEACQHASGRLGVILDSYTVYLDLWVADAGGKVIANGRPDKYPGIVGTSVASAPWFKNAMATRNGGEFAVDDVTRNPHLGAGVSTWAAAIREGGRETGRPLGALGIFFDWDAQSADVVGRVRLTDEEKPRTRCMLLDSNRRILVASDGKGQLSETYPLDAAGKSTGFYQKPSGTLVGFAQTPGYETYQGLGWYGVIEQTPAKAALRQAA